MSAKQTLSTRDAYYDNLRLFLMFITVVCHGLKTFWTSDPLFKDLYKILLLFVMPLFVVLTGFFAKGMAEAGNPKRMRIINFGVIYVIAQLLKSALVRGAPFFEATYGNWYLICVMVWYAALPAIAKFKPAIVMTVSILAALLFGMDSGTSIIMQTSRMICFLPFFLLGFYLTKEHAELLKKPQVRWIGAAVLVAVIIICIVFWNDISPYRIMHADRNYAQLKVSNLEGMSLRQLWYILATAMGFGVLCVIPRRRTIFTVLGTRTMAIYIIHTTIYHYLIKKTEFFDWIGQIDPIYLRLIVLILLSVVVTIFCGNKLFGKAFDWLLGYDFRFFMKANKE